MRQRHRYAAANSSEKVLPADVRLLSTTRRFPTGLIGVLLLQRLSAGSSSLVSLTQIRTNFALVLVAEVVETYVRILPPAMPHRYDTFFCVVRRDAVGHTFDGRCARPSSSRPLETQGLPASRRDEPVAARQKLVASRARLRPPSWKSHHRRHNQVMAYAGRRCPDL